VASQGTEAALFGLSRPYILVKFTLGALVKPLFRQFQGELLRIPRRRTSPYTISANFALTEFYEVRLIGILGSSLM
jgi:hypothetical protein